jgi:hypothetical protein
MRLARHANALTRPYPDPCSPEPGRSQAGSQFIVGYGGCGRRELALFRAKQRLRWSDQKVNN